MRPLLVLIDDDVQEHHRLERLLPELEVRGYLTGRRGLDAIRQCVAESRQIAL
ncbi:MAG: hypothetical protein HC828_03565 [Blastochloris sp.]|nr:hypothetical protein [Blastochloris sp.]